MKKRLIAICLLVVLVCNLIFTGCTDEETKPDTTTTTHITTTNPEKYQKVEHVGQVPDVLKKVVENNLFQDVIAFDGRVLKSGITAMDEKDNTITQIVQMMDVYGNELASYTVTSDDSYHITTLTATEDGGFLFVLGFTDHYDNTKGKWASEDGFASRIIKCDKNGNMEFDVAFEGFERYSFEFCFEKDEKFYFFGTMETPETNKLGVSSPTDIYMSIFDKNCSVLKSQLIAGTDYDDLNAVERTDDGFLLSIDSQSRDGDFVGSTSIYPIDWTFTVNDDLEVIQKKMESGRDYFDTKIGEKDKIPVYKSDDLLKNFDGGTPTAYIDYKDFYLIVSENITGIYEHTPIFINSLWYYTETVYSGYDKNGNLIFRTSVDSSPDYGSMIDINPEGIVNYYEGYWDMDNKSGESATLNIKSFGKDVLVFDYTWGNKHGENVTAKLNYGGIDFYAGVKFEIEDNLYGGLLFDETYDTITFCIANALDSSYGDYIGEFERHF